jgi:competence protein ComEC
MRAILVFVLLACLLWSRWPATCPSQAVCVSVLDIGQGDAIYIDSPQLDVLVDGGPDRTVIERLGMVMPLWDRSIDYLINTHPHADHLNGLITVLERFRVDMVFDGDQALPLNVQNIWWGEGHGRGVLTAGEVLDLAPDVSLRVLWPVETFEGSKLDDPNVGSIILLLQAYDSTMLLTGDAGLDEEGAIAGLAGDIDVLKVGHHGSRHSSGLGFLTATKPEVAIISAGENDYGHPSDEALANLAAVGAQTYTTAEQGTVRVVFLPDGYAISTLWPN